MRSQQMSGVPRWVQTFARMVPILSVLVWAGGCGKEAGLGRVGPTRAMWVTRWDYRTPEDVRQVVANCESVGLNTILLQVRGNGTVFYPSSMEPWAEEFGHKDPGFDPLAVAIEEAHDRDMELHAWVNVMPAWRGKKPPQSRRQLYHTHPEWFLMDQQGRRQPLTAHYVILNPCLPEVRDYLTAVFRELCTRYDLDGLHMDYIRFVTHGSEAGADYPHDEETLRLFNEATGQTPAGDPQAWDDWRREAVTQLVADVRGMMREVSPGARLSAAVFGNRTLVRTKLFQDGERWMADDLIDLAFPMIYTASMENFTRMAEDWRSHSHGKSIVPGLGLFKHKDDADSIEQVQAAWSWGDGFCLFAYSSLFGAPAQSGEGPAPARSTRAAERRRLRLKNLGPVLLSLPGGEEAATRLTSVPPTGRRT